MSSINRLRATQTCRNWNEAFPIGTDVVFEGRKAKTWSHAGIGMKDEPVVFLEGIQEAVSISRLEVPGWEVTTKKPNTRPE